MKDARDILIDALKEMGANGLYKRCCSGCVNLINIEDKPSCIFYEERIAAADCDMFEPISAHKPSGVYD